MNFSDFDKTGMNLPSDNRYFATRYLFDGKKHVFLVQVRKTPDSDTDLKVTIRKETGTIERTYTFGFGLCPAYTAVPGSVFTFELTAPPPRKVSIRFLKRPGSEPVLQEKDKKETNLPPTPISGQKS